MSIINSFDISIPHHMLTKYGSRPYAYIEVLLYLIANIGLAFSNSFVALMVFRGIQAAGSAATISVGKSNPSPMIRIKKTNSRW